MNNTRNYWIKIMKKIATPVLDNLSRGELRKNMVIKGNPERFKFAYLEAFARTIVGISPWLELPINLSNMNDEMDKGTGLRENGLDEIEQYAALAREAISAAVNPDSPDYMIYDHGGQPLVDTAFLAQGILRAPVQLGERLDNSVKENLVKALKDSRKIKPCYSNWLLFSAMVETALYLLGEDFDIVRIDYALKEHENWYLGDGVYGDGPEFHWDYYNSFVIQPMLLDIVKIIEKEDPEISGYRNILLKRAQRYGEILERLIGPDGSFPPLGRSLSYRFAVFHLLSQLSLEKELPESLNPGQVKTALTAVIKKMINIPDTFDSNGWLNIGFSGFQPDIGEIYINTGSLYLCSTVFLPLGLPEGDPFWAADKMDWTAKKIWAGENLPADKVLET